MNQYRTIRIKKETHYRLLEMKAKLTREKEKPHTLDDVIDSVLDSKEKSE